MGALELGRIDQNKMGSQSPDAETGPGCRCPRWAVCPWLSILLSRRLEALNLLSSVLGPETAAQLLRVLAAPEGWPPCKPLGTLAASEGISGGRGCGAEGNREPCDLPPGSAPPNFGGPVHPAVPTAASRGCSILQGQSLLLGINLWDSLVPGEGRRLQHGGPPSPTLAASQQLPIKLPLCVSTVTWRRR